MKVTTKGQVTIPQEVREKLGIYVGSEVRFEIEGDIAKLIPMKNPTRNGRRLVDRMRGKGSVKMTTDEILALTRGEE